jgi:hypothetical protein
MAKDSMENCSEWSVAGSGKIAAPTTQVPAPVPAHFNPPAPPPDHKFISVRLHWPRVALALAIIAGYSLGALYWWREASPQVAARDRFWQWTT